MDRTSVANLRQSNSVMTLRSASSDGIPTNDSMGMVLATHRRYATGQLSIITVQERLLPMIDKSFIKPSLVEIQDSL